MAQNEADKAAAEAREADQQRRQQLAEQVKRQSEEARKASEETLREQESMRPEPSQEEADLIKVGAVNPLERKETEQPQEGPAARAAEAERPLGYQTRDAQARRGPGRPKQSVE
jgi:hypothetical protein